MPESATQDSSVPQQFANVLPPDIAGAGQTRLLIKAVEDAVQGLKEDVRDIKSHRHSDFVFHICIFGGGFLVLAGMLITGYMKLDDRLMAITNTSIRAETKLEDLLQRIPPVPTPPARR